MNQHLRWLSAVMLALLLYGGSGGSTRAADPWGSLSQALLVTRLEGPYAIGAVGTTFVNDGAIAVDVRVDGHPASADTAVSLELAPVGDAAARESIALDPCPERPGVWVLNPAPLDTTGEWEATVTVAGPAGEAAVDFPLYVYPPRPPLAPWIPLVQPVIPAIVLVLLLLLLRARGWPMFYAEPATPSVPAGG